MNFREFLVDIHFQPRHGQLGAIATIDEGHPQITLFQEARGLGMTTILTLYGLYHACKHENSNIVMVCYNAAFTNVSESLIQDHINKSVIKLFIKKRNKHMIQLSNGSKINFISSNSSFGLRGMSVDLLLIDNPNLFDRLDCFPVDFLPAVKMNGKIISDTIMFNLNYKRGFIRSEYE